MIQTLKQFTGGTRLFDADPEWKEVNKADVLEFLRKNKSADRYVPEWIAESSCLKKSSSFRTSTSLFGNL